MRSTRSYAEVLTQSRRIHQAVCHPRRHIGLPTNSKTKTWRPAPAIPTDSHFHLFAKPSQHTQHRQSLVSDSTSCQQSSKHTVVQVAYAELPVNIVSAPWQSATTTNKSDSENLTFVAWDLTFVGLFGPCPCPWSHVTCHRKFMSPTPMHHVPHDPNSPTSTCTHARRHVHVHVPRHADGDARSPCPRGAPLPQSTLIILS